MALRPKPRIGPAASAAKATSEQAWTFFTNHAHVLFCLAEDPEARLRDIAARVGITERAVQRIVTNLHDEGYIRVEKLGRRNRYQVVRKKPLRHAIEAHCSVDAVLRVVLGE